MKQATCAPSTRATASHLSIVAKVGKPPRNWKRGPYSKRSESPAELEARRASILHALGESPRLVR
jgi:hypothetical protein